MLPLLSVLVALESIGFSKYLFIGNKFPDAIEEKIPKLVLPEVKSFKIIQS